MEPKLSRSLKCQWPSNHTGVFLCKMNWVENFKGSTKWRDHIRSPFPFSPHLEHYLNITQEDHFFPQWLKISEVNPRKDENELGSGMTRIGLDTILCEPTQSKQNRKCLICSTLQQNHWTELNIEFHQHHLIPQIPNSLGLGALLGGVVTSRRITPAFPVWNAQDTGNVRRCLGLHCPQIVTADLGICSKIVQRPDPSSSAGRLNWLMFITKSPDKAACVQIQKEQPGPTQGTSFRALSQEQAPERHQSRTIFSATSLLPGWLSARCFVSFLTPPPATPENRISELDSH